MRRGAAAPLLGLALLAAAAVLLSYGHGLTWFQDSWEFLMNRRAFTADALFTPHNEHIVVLPVARLLSLFEGDQAIVEKNCPECTRAIPIAARRCPECTAVLADGAPMSGVSG